MMTQQSLDAWVKGPKNVSLPERPCSVGELISQPEPAVEVNMQTDYPQKVQKKL